VGGVARRPPSVEPAVLAEIADALLADAVLVDD
jgi:hypothetical protein